MQNYCTLFNIKYLSRAIALHESMERNIEEYRLYMFAFDDISYDILQKNNLSNVEIIHYKQFETDELLMIKKERNIKEYLWTVTPFTIDYVFNNYNVENCTYIDADIYFFNNPILVFSETPEFNTIVTEHRYYKKYNQTNTSGRFCVQFNTFIRTENSLEILKDWKKSVANWCYERHENGLFGDQMYLNDWPTKFKNVHIAEHLGIGIAPWNVLNYKLIKDHIGVNFYEVNRKARTKIIFFHFHGLKIYSNKWADMGNYSINKSVYIHIYKPYLISIRKANNQILCFTKTKEIFSPFEWSLFNILRQLKRIIFGNFNFIRF